MSAITERLRALVASRPEDAGARAVYADALLQEDDPRGMFITLQTRLETGLPPHKREAALREIEALRRAHESAWTAAARGWAEVRFKAGFIHAIRSTAAAFTDASALLAVEPVVEVNLTEASDATWSRS